MSDKEKLFTDSLNAIVKSAIQYGSFDDSCSLTGEDYAYCHFCGSSNLDAAKATHNPDAPIEHDANCIYLRTTEYLDKDAS